MKYRVVVTETQYYELYVEADSQDDAEEIAIEEYGYSGDIFSTFVDVAHIEEGKL